MKSPETCRYPTAVHCSTSLSIERSKPRNEYLRGRAETRVEPIESAMLLSRTARTYGVGNRCHSPRERTVTASRNGPGRTSMAMQRCEARCASRIRSIKGLDHASSGHPPAWSSRHRRRKSCTACVYVEGASDLVRFTIATPRTQEIALSRERCRTARTTRNSHREKDTTRIENQLQLHLLPHRISKNEIHDRGDRR